MGKSTCEEIDAVVDLILVNGIFQEVATFQILIGFGVDDYIFEEDHIDCHRMVVYDFIYGFTKKEIEVQIIFLL
jgi:hypothetical protein